MAVSTATAWTDTTDVIAYVGACRVTAVEVDIAPAATSTSFLQLWNSADATPGTTAPTVQIEIPIETSRRGSQFKVVFPKGMRFATGLTWFVATASAGGTAATTHAPLAVSVYYVVGG